MKHSASDKRTHERLAADRERVEKLQPLLSAYEQEVEIAFREGREGRELAIRRCRHLEELTRVAIANGVALPAYTVAAVGSFGRGAVALKSDVDIRFLVASEAHEEFSEIAEGILYPLWDAGLSIGHQVIATDEILELARTDLTTATSLLDLRHLGGPKEPLDELLRRAWEGIFAEVSLGEFVDRLEEETRLRHERFGGSVYLLEPEVKSGPGGLRDLDGARWVARARFRVGDDGTGIWKELVRLGVLLEREAREMMDAEEFLMRVRNHLHRMAGRRSERLTFDAQESVSLALGYRDTGGENAFAAGAERFMQDYYLHARSISRARERLFVRSRPPPRRARNTPEVDLGGGIRAFEGYVTFADVSLLDEDPAIALRLLMATATHGLPTRPFARDAVSRAAGDPTWCERLRGSSEALGLFVDLVTFVAEAKTRRGSFVAELHDLGLLLAMVPEFAPVTGRVHHDTYHVFTVDVHSVAAVDCLRALARGDLVDAQPLASRLAAEVARPRQLYLATLLHDVGKGYPDATGSRKNHSASGAEISERVLARFGLAPEEIADARHLVLQHLSMYQIATRRDLDDASVIREFSSLVRGREGLRELYLLTIADVTTTSPNAMTSWKGRMLEELYLRTDAFLSGEKGGFDAERIERVREQVTQLSGREEVSLQAFMNSMPDRYLLANPPEAIVAHATAAHCRVGPAIAALVPSRHRGATELCVVAEDRPGLLARIAAAITGARLEVLSAEVYTRKIPGGVEAVDIFAVRERSDGSSMPEGLVDRLRRDLERVLSPEVDVAEFVRAKVGPPSALRRSPAVTTEIVVDDRVSPSHTVVEVFCKDRPGLLYELAACFHSLGLSISLSKINTEGMRAADVFYVTEQDGSKIPVGERTKEIREALVRVVGTA